MSPSELEIRMRRMRWAIESPSLLSYPESVQFCRSDEHLSSMIQKIDSCTQLPELPAKLRMGKYFEQLVQDCVELDPTKELVLVNEPVYDGKVTIGEIDMVIKDVETGDYQHWEIALKYYLQTHEGDAHELMIGPNAVDNLDRKIKKLFSHQLPLSDSPNLSSKLHELGIQTLEKKLFLKGMFFYRLGHSESHPKYVNPDHEQGWWVYHHEASEFLRNDLKWSLCWKPDWIGPNHLETDLQLMTRDEMLSQIQREFKESNRSLLLIGSGQTDTGWAEQTRGFVVNDDWPHLMLEKG